MTPQRVAKPSSVVGISAVTHTGVRPPLTKSPMNFRVSGELIRHKPQDMHLRGDPRHPTVKNMACQPVWPSTAEFNTITVQKGAPLLFFRGKPVQRGRGANTSHRMFQTENIVQMYIGGNASVGSKGTPYHSYGPDQVPYTMEDRVKTPSRLSEGIVGYAAEQFLIEHRKVQDGEIMAVPVVMEHITNIVTTRAKLANGLNEKGYLTAGTPVITGIEENPLEKGGFRVTSFTGKRREMHNTIHNPARNFIALRTGTIVVPPASNGSAMVTIHGRFTPTVAR